jgi:hypothetical protein
MRHTATMFLYEYFSCASLAHTLHTPLKHPLDLLFHDPIWSNPRSNPCHYPQLHPTHFGPTTTDPRLNLTLSNPWPPPGPHLHQSKFGPSSQLTEPTCECTHRVNSIKKRKKKKVPNYFSIITMFAFYDLPHLLHKLIATQLYTIQYIIIMSSY